jgi:hypothetical protein
MTEYYAKGQFHLNSKRSLFFENDQSSSAKQISQESPGLSNVALFEGRSINWIQEESKQ